MSSQGLSEVAMNEKNKWEPIVPVPLDAPEPKVPYSSKRHLIDQYRYENESGQLCFLIVRFLLHNGKKKCVPYSYGYLDGEGPKWRLKGSLRPYPLFNLRTLCLRSSPDVLVVEGEKTAVAASILFPELVVITSPFGSGQAHLSNWSRLKGRRVKIWPDNDPAGGKYAESVARQAMDAGALEVRIVKIEPNKFPVKWDLADDIPVGVSRDDLTSMLENAIVADRIKELTPPVPDSPESAVQLPFKLTPTSVLRAVKDKDGNVDMCCVCSRLEVLALTRNEHGEDWGRLLGVPDPEGRLHKYAMPMTSLAGDGIAFRESLLSRGLIIEPSSKHFLAAYVGTCQPKRLLTCVGRLGWHGNSFVLPAEVFGDQNIVYQGPYGADGFKVSGTLEDWKKNVAKYCSGNSRLILACGAGFAAPLLDIVGAESGGIHFRGKSSVGKTTVLGIGASIWGDGNPKNGFIRNWRATCNGLEGTAASRCDLLLCLDEMGQANPREVGDAAYMLANGQGKNRATRTGAAKEPEKWRNLFLSTGEVSLSDQMSLNDSKIRATAGQEVRIIDVPADSGKGYGIFDCIHEFSSSKELVEHLRTATSQYYGTAGRAFVEKVAKLPRHELQIRIRNLVKEITECQAKDSDSQVKRVFSKLALIGGAAILAAELDVFPINRDEILVAIESIASDWLKNRGSSESHEKMVVLKQVRLFFERFGSSRFELVSQNDNVNSVNDRGSRDPLDRAGYKRLGSDGAVEFLVTKEVLHSEILRGVDIYFAIQVLIDEKYLRSNEAPRPTFKTTLPGASKQSRVFCFTSKVLEDAQAENDPDGETWENGNGS